MKKQTLLMWADVDGMLRVVALYPTRAEGQGFKMPGHSLVHVRVTVEPIGARKGSRPSRNRK